MRLRVPEIFLGAFLAVAVFAMGMLFASSFAPPDRHNEQQTASETSTKEGVKHGFWGKTADDPVAYFTLWLVGFTGVLAVSTIGLGVATVFLYRAGEKQIEVARIGANAADLSARAAIALQLPIIRIKPDNLSHSDARIGGREFEECSVASVILSNLGPTKAFPLEILHGWTVGNELPPEPSYRYVDSFLPNFILEPDPKITPSKRLTVAMPLEPGQWPEILKGNYLWFYCALHYEDFMGEKHIHGFCWRWANIGMGLAWRVDDTHSYNRKT